ncbi:hypothetical protein BBP40_003799 [Aspergillus hancockii]|nr:hypothetical protein BBP40_003799 [Aspergillus hancockii]
MSEGFFLAVTLTHIMTDGMGLLEIFRRQLQPLSTTQTCDDTTGIQRSEDTIDFSPGVLKTALSMVDEFLPAVLPQSFHIYILKTQYWPAPAPLPMSPTAAKEKLHMVDFGGSGHTLIAGLKSYGKLSKLGSVQPFLHTAGMIALLAAAEHHSTPLDALKTETPMSVGKESLGPPPLGGNFTAIGEFQAAVEQLYSQTLAESTLQYHNYIHSPKGQSDFLSNVGMLRLTPGRPALNF